MSLASLAAAVLLTSVAVAAEAEEAQKSAQSARPASAPQRVAHSTPEVETRIIEDGTIVRRTSKFEVRITPIRDEEQPGTDFVSSDRAEDDIAASTCPQIQATYSNLDFEGQNPQQVVVQAGFVETEIAAAQHFADPDGFPLRVDVMEKIFATSSSSVTTTTEWSVLIYSGPPGGGNLIEVFSSDDVILPHLVIPPGTNAVNVQVIVDPNDPEPIIVPANPSNSVTVGFRIDKHHNPPTSSCPCPFIGTMPAVCCPPPTSSNAFPTTDSLTGPTNAAGNWLFARDCPGAGPLCGVAPSGWYNFTTSGLPNGDWNIRVTYTALNCPGNFGACCMPNGTCQILAESNCIGGGGTYQGDGVSCGDVFCVGSGACCTFGDGGLVCEVRNQDECDDLNGIYEGDNTTCADAECPFLLGACCIDDGGSTQCQLLTSEDCDDAEGVWLGGGTDCDSSICNGACCIEATGACVDFDLNSCNAVDGIWQGHGTTCAETICFPSGACCLPDGSCVDDYSPEECDDVEGIFQGDGTTCAEINCPEPAGACCLSNGNCLFLTEITCLSVAGQWAGHDTDCSDTSGSGTADDCEDDPDPCPADFNGDNVVDALDLLELLGQWGDCADPGNCPADINGDTVVDALDLLELLGQWGDCP